MSRLMLVLKAVAVGLLTCLLLIPLSMINGTIAERQRFRQEAVASVARSFAGAQSLSGPVLVVPYVEDVKVVSKTKEGVDAIAIEKRWGHWLFFPDAMQLQGKLKPELRKRGLHEVRVYQLDTQEKTNFDVRLPSESDASRRLGQPYLSLSIADVRGLIGTPVLKVGGVVVPLQQGIGGHREGNGLHALLPIPVQGERMSLAVDVTMSLSGTESLAIAPIAGTNQIRLSSTWPHPQFSGRFLPRTHHINDSGFDALWDISSLAAGSQEQYRQGKTGEALDTLDLSLVEPVNMYSQVDRASKYGFLFVMLTFVGFFMFELIKRLAIHPIQYALVGLALAIFFLLLLSLSEHIAFPVAYLIASVACISLLGIYLSAVLKNRARGVTFSAMLTLLYAALYGLLVSEDNALVMGSVMLFAILAAIMLVTRRIDWYALSAKPTATLSE